MLFILYCHFFVRSNLLYRNFFCCKMNIFVNFFKGDKIEFLTTRRELLRSRCVCVCVREREVRFREKNPSWQKARKLDFAVDKKGRNCCLSSNFVVSRRDFCVLVLSSLTQKNTHSPTHTPTSTQSYTLTHTQTRTQSNTSHTNTCAHMVFYFPPQTHSCCYFLKDWTKKQNSHYFRIPQK